MSRPLLLVALAAALALPAASAQAQRMYKCTDAKGKVYYTQIPPKECQGQTTQELSRQGRVIKENEVLTPEKIAAREAEQKKKAEQDRVAAEEKRKNAALLNTYASEKDIDDARARALSTADDAIKAAEKRISEAQKRREGLEKEREFFAKKPVPPKLQQDIQSAEAEIKSQRELIDAKKKDIGSIGAKYDDDKRRYLEVTSVNDPRARAQMLPKQDGLVVKGESERSLKAAESRQQQEARSRAQQDQRDLRKADCERNPRNCR